MEQRGADALGAAASTEYQMPSCGATDTLSAVTTDEGRAAYSVDIGIGATSEQTAAVQRLFDDIGLEATVSAT